MSYPKHLYRHPGPYGHGTRSYGVKGASDEASEAVLVRLGWCATKEEAWGSNDSVDLKGLREEYQSLAGTRPFMGWDEAKLREKIAALEAK